MPGRCSDSVAAPEDDVSSFAEGAVIRQLGRTVANVLSHLCGDNAFHLRTAKNVAQFVFSTFEDALLLLRQIFPGAIDVEIQHRYRGLIRRALASGAPLSRAFQRERDLARICCFEDIRLEIKRVATLHYSGRPAATFTIR